MKQRKLFCEISPFTYKISLLNQKLRRKFKDILLFSKLATIQGENLPILVYEHKSLMRRKLANVREDLQENKALNLSIATPKVSGIIIKPNQIFSFWNLVGSCSSDKGYKEGLTISLGNVSEAVGGGMCQFTNLLHWMILHTPLDIIEHHHHDGLDLFPDFDRKVPFGTGTSIFYNYKDYRFQNNTNQTFQIIVYTTEEYLCGEIRSDKELEFEYNIFVRDEKFVKENDNVYRVGEVMRVITNKKTGEVISEEILKENHAKVMYEVPDYKIENNL